MNHDFLTHEQVTEMRRQALSELIERYGQAEVARRMKRQPQQIHDMAKTKSFGEKVALEFEREWRNNAGNGLIDLLAPRPRPEPTQVPDGWKQLDEIGRAKVEAFISGLLAQRLDSAAGDPRVHGD